MKILSGDIGGTNARLALCEVEGRTVRRDIQATYDSQRYDTLADIARDFISAHQIEVRNACFGVPGPVQGRRAQVTNLPWNVDADELERNLGIDSVFLLNDLEANAHGLETLSDADFKELRPGSGVSGNAGLLSAGTGLGEAGLVWDGQRHRPFACEGGHTDFAPRDDEEIDLHRFLRDKFGPHVSWERCVSGPGLVNIYEFYLSVDPGAEDKALAEAIASGSDPAAEISKAAASGKGSLAYRAVMKFLALYGAEAGNLALKVLAVSGMYLGGGIAPKLAPLLPESDFIERFQAKGRMRPLLETIGLSIVMNDRAALQGAASYAARRARGEQA